jgi:hypothetical protein
MKLYTIHDRNMTEIDPITLLAHKCMQARKAAEVARAEQIRLESELLALPAVNKYLKDSGSTTFLNGFFKVQNKLNQKWNQPQVADILINNDWPVMPFDIEYKPNAANLKMLKTYHPELYKKLNAALTETPAKPYFVFAEV